MGKRIFLILVLAALAAAPAASAGEYVRPGWTGNANVWLGNHMLESADFAPVDDFLEFGAVVDFRARDWPVNLSVEAYYADDEELFTESNDTVSKYSLSMGTLHLGVRKYFPYSEWVQPFLGGGLAGVYMNQEWVDSKNNKTSDSLMSGGFFVGCGILLQPAPHFNIGLSGKWSFVPVEMAARDLDSNGGNFQGGLEFGYHW
ncbi:MAG: outer membrane beta-barrel protein [Pseudomonadota bacterium]